MLRRAWVRALCVLPLFLTPTAVRSADAASPAASNGGSTLLVAMQSAANARQVPVPVIEATAYVNTRWEWITTPQHNHGVGPMDVLPSQMALASSLSGHTQAAIANDLAANLDAGAALMAHYHTSGADLNSWSAAVATTQGSFVASQIYAVLRSGATRTTSTGETITLAPQSTSPGSTSGAASLATTACSPSPDYGGTACWTPADSSNYTVANRGHDYPIDMIVIHDIEGSYGSAIQDFQTPNYGASAHYVVSFAGDVTQMVREKDVAWHAGNWDYNTRAIGIEHEGYVAYNLYTTAEYNASAAIAASICSRYGVPMDRTHVIGHNEVPDPNNPGPFGGSDHHTDPGPYWDWTYYMAQAQADARQLPSPPHLMPDVVATAGPTSATVTWTPARTCRAADAATTGYTVTGQPGNLSIDLPGTATTTTFTGLQPGTSYTFTVTAHNSYGDGAAPSNSVIPGRCDTVGVNANPASPQPAGTQVTISATSTGCANPTYEFWIKAPGASLYTLAQGYSSSATYSWNTAGLAGGTYAIDVWAKDANSPGTYSNAWGTWDGYNADRTYSLAITPCASASLSASPSSAAKAGMAVSITATASGCLNPRYEFWVLAPGSSLFTLAQPYGSNATLNWNTSGLSSGTYRINVWVQDASSPGLYSNAYGSWDTYNANLTYDLTVGCPSVADSAAPAGAARAGTAVSVTATAPGCPNPQYEFWILKPGATLYALVQPYGGSATFNWSTSSQPAGSYRINVWVRDSSSPGVFSNASGSWDAYNANLTYTLSAGCPSVSDSASPGTAAMAGMNVTVTAVAPGCANPEYEFWILKPGASLYTLAQAYSSSATLNWSTGGQPLGSYVVNVWVKAAGSPGVSSNDSGSWDAYNAGLAYALTQGCPSVSDSASPASSTTIGTTVSVTASAPGCSSPEYEFWILYPGASLYTLARAYGSSPTLSWSTSGQPAGTYRINVWVRQSGTSGVYSNSSGGWDAYNANLTYLLR